MRALLLALVAAALLALPASASADDTPFIDWSSWLPPAAGTYQPSSVDDCRSGKPRCVEKVIKAMTERFDAQAASCDHNAMFALHLPAPHTRRVPSGAMAHAGLLPATRTFVNHEDAGVRPLLFDAYDDWHAGNKSQGATPPGGSRWTPPSKKQVSGAGDMLLGYQRPHQPRPALRAGRHRPGQARRLQPQARPRQGQPVPEPRHADAVPRAGPGASTRRSTTTSLPGTLDDMLTFQAFPAMRETAWRNAETAGQRDHPAGSLLVEKYRSRTPPP